MGTTLAADSASILGFHIQRFNELKDMDAIVSSEWEERWGMDLEISYFSDRRWESNCIQTAPFEVVLG